MGGGGGGGSPVPTPIEPGGTYARSPSTEPPYLGEMIYPLFRVLVTIGNYKKHPFSWFSWEISPRDYGQQNTPLSRENGNVHAAPLCIRVGGGGGGVR